MFTTHYSHVVRLAHGALAPSSAEPPTSTTDAAVSPHLTELLVFTGGILVVFSVVALLAGGWRATIARFRTIARVYALISVAGLGVMLALVGLEKDAQTAAFALLGTVAGYLAGASGTTERSQGTQDPPDVASNVL